MLLCCLPLDAAAGLLAAADELDVAQREISARTVSTHLSRIFEKLGVDSRGELADFVRDSPLLGEA